MSTQASQRPDLPDRVCFGPLEIHVPRRELRVAGQLQPVAPRVFDLLVFLIQHRDRVVSKNELLTRVWNGAVVSEGVIARAVMKARQTLGDHGDQPIIIKTIHRVGYRFMGELDSPTQEAGSMAAAAPAPEPPQPRLRLALMALENRTGNPEHDWVGAGLHALVLQALETDPRLSLIALASLQAAQDALPAGLSTQDSTTALCGMLGMDALVHAVLVQQEGGFSIEFGVHGRPPRHDSGSAAVHGSDLTVLGQQLARGLETLLFPQQPMLVSFESADPLANHAYARAMQKSREGDWLASSHLLQVVLDAEPASTTARLQWTRELANLRDPRAIEAGENLLEAARAGGDLRLLATTHEALSRAHFNIGGHDAIPRSRHHMSEALRLAEPFDGEDWVTRIYIGQGISAFYERDIDAAARLHARALQLDELAGNRLRQTVILINQSVTSLARSEPLLAKRAAEAALALGQRMGLHASNASALAIVALAEANMGVFDHALQRIEDALALVPGFPDFEMECAAWVALIACDFRVESGRTAVGTDEAFSRLARAGPNPSLQSRSVQCMAEGYRAEFEGDAPGARLKMTEALELAATSGYSATLHEVAPHLLRLLLRQQRWTESAVLIERLHALPTLATDPPLQALLLQGRAAASHAQGRAGEALGLLTAAVRLAPPMDRCHARIRLDLAWLALEEGELELARQHLRCLGMWQLQHPAGQAVSARIYFLEGHWPDAVRQQKACLDSCGKPASHLFGVLLAHFEQAAGRAGPGSPPKPPALPRSPALLSLL